MKIILRTLGGIEIGVEAARVYIPGFEWIDTCAHQAVMGEAITDCWAISCPHSGFRFLSEAQQDRVGAPTLDEEIEYVRKLLTVNKVTPEMMHALIGDAQGKWAVMQDREEERVH